MFPQIVNPQSWTLFLDRDGVINRKIEGDYVKSWNEFKFIPLVKDALAELRNFFGRAIIISNQQGIGKGIMNEKDLDKIHCKMLMEIEMGGGFIDKIYFCPDIASSNSPNRKPEPGMALQAKNDFPEIEFKNSVMVGDALTDMELAAKLGMIAVYIGADKKIIHNNKCKIDYVFNNLKELSDFIYEKNHK